MSTSDFVVTLLPCLCWILCRMEETALELSPVGMISPHFVVGGSSVVYDRKLCLCENLLYIVRFCVIVYHESLQENARSLKSACRTIVWLVCLLFY